jgi:hypothetical protein
MADPPTDGLPKQPRDQASAAGGDTEPAEELSKDFELAPDAAVRSIDMHGRVERRSGSFDSDRRPVEQSAPPSLFELPEGEGQLELVEQARPKARPARRRDRLSAVPPARGRKPRRWVPLAGLGSLVGILFIAAAVGFLRTRRPVPTPSELYVTKVDSEPAGAAIFVDGKDTGRTTPATFSPWDWVTPHEVALKLPGHATFRQLVAEGPHSNTVKAVLNLAASLDLQSTPPGAEVWQGEFKIGTTPGHFELSAGAKQTFTLRLAGYLPNTFELTGSPDEALTRTVTLTPGGTLSLDSDPTGASVQIDDHPAGETPLRVDLEAVRPHRLLVSAPGLTAERRKFVIPPGKTLALSVFLGDEMDRELRGLLRETDRRLRAAQQEMQRLDDPRQSQEYFQAMARNRKRGRLEAEIDGLESKVERLQADIDAHRSAIEDRLEKTEPQ